MSPGLSSLGLTTLIISSARNASTHKRNCRRLAQHVELIGKLLEKLRSTDVVTLPAVKEPLDGLDEALKQALELVESCSDRSCLYMLAMGWSIVHQFRRVQTQIDRYLKLVPLISLVHEFRMQSSEEGLQAIEQDEREYSLDEEDVEASNVILKPERTKNDANILEKSLSRRYPKLDFQEALQEEKLKLRVELQRSRTVNDSKQCLVIEHLIDVTENVVNVNVLPGMNVHKLIVDEPTYIKGYEIDAKTSYANECKSQWRFDLFDCCSEPCLSLKTCICPCRVFSSIANVVSKGKISRRQVIGNLMAYSLLCGCCCYSCCVRKELRRLFNIEGGLCDDYITHLICFCCAMVQEWRELKARGFEGNEEGRMIPPPNQYMKP